MCDTACRTNFVVGQYQYVVGPNQYVSNFELVQINSVKFSWSISTGSVTVGQYQFSHFYMHIYINVKLVCKISNKNFQTFIGTLFKHVQT